MKNIMSLKIKRPQGPIASLAWGIGGYLMIIGYALMIILLVLGCIVDIYSMGSAKPSFTIILFQAFGLFFGGLAVLGVVLTVFSQVGTRK